MAETPFELRFGYQTRWDDIRVGLQDTYIRRPYDTVRNDRVGEANFSLFSDIKTKWTPWLTTVVGTRWDYYWASVGGIQTYLASPIVGFVGDNPAQPVRLWTAPFNNGASTGQLLSPKASVIINPFDDKTDFYLNFGRGSIRRTRAARRRRFQQPKRRTISAMCSRSVGRCFRRQRAPKSA